MIFFAWLSAALYFFVRGIVLLVWGILQMLFYAVLLFGWVCVMGVMLPFRLAAALNRPRQRST